jgi:hypothetical protein
MAGWISTDLKRALNRLQKERHLCLEQVAEKIEVDADFLRKQCNIRMGKIDAVVYGKMVGLMEIQFPRS